MRPAKSNYRPDIDGLRAVAVLGVVFYHAGVEFVPGGYVGVDVFFVISGFLITSILLRQAEDGTLSIKTFYERRIRRIMPALFVVLFATLAFGFFQMIPWDYQELATSTQYAVCSLANVFFHDSIGGYFGGMVDRSPLLHTWSLGVEEQFYIGFPLIMMVSMRYRWSRSKLFLLLGGLSLLSLSLCIWRMGIAADDSFYYIPYRAWELLAGALLAIRPPRLGKGKIAGCTAGLGLVMIVAAMTLYDSGTLFPGWAAVPPCLGAAMIIAAGSSSKGYAYRFLAWKPLVGIGLISYSVYLWHWPILAFQNYAYLTSLDGIPQSAKLLAGLASLPIGYLSWRLVERPFRNDRLAGARLFLTWAAISVAFIVLAGVIRYTNGFEHRVDTELAEQFEAARGNMATLTEALDNQIPPGAARVYPDDRVPATFALWGDSHAAALVGEMAKIAREHRTSIRFYGRAGTPPIVGLRRADQLLSPEAWQPFNDEVLRILESDDTIKGVVLHARWRHYTTQGAKGMPGELPGEPPIILDSDGKKFSSNAEAQAWLATCLRNTVVRLRAAGKTVFIIYPVPEVGYDISRVLFREALLRHDPADFKISADEMFFSQQKFVTSLLDSLPDGTDLVRLKPHEILIADGLIRVVEDDRLLYFDNHHLTKDGARSLAPLFEEIFTHLPTSGAEDAK